ncbi:Lovastatin diketide synthase LovF [Cytospora mali]|uniref:Lovastatin diketide synthase LovF n=1 Tax=Cytospora mali TaxID=578113 RepID=A0A194W5M1_CYTMA|nr:Lovastatin diketide synthase LovF [Valsa mali]
MGDATQPPLAPIAVVGLSFRLPGGANSPDEYWDLLASGRSAWTPVPASRFNEAAFHHPSPDDAHGTSNHRGGHFITPDLRRFDAAFFRLSPQQAAVMDPQQRLLLEMTYEAFEGAGWARERLAGSATGVYVASFTADFDRDLYRDPLDLPTYYITGVERAILANRISHAFDLRGPSFTLDTACSGGLVALHQACESLRSGESTAAVVAAPNLILGPDQYVGMSNLHMLSDTGRSYPFDRRGVGYGRGEGVVVLALKRLDAALRDGDPIRTVIRATAVNHDGYTASGITYPNGKAQESLIRSAYAKAGLDPQGVAYVEAHGTGTVAGDQEELGALARVFASADRQNSSVPLYVGSVKGAIGHTECASGLASVVKAVLMLDRGEIPPVAGFAEPKPGLPLDHICIPNGVVPWPNIDGIVPRVSINSFGFGGTNAHAIVERGPRPPKPMAAASEPRLFVLSANTQTSLAAMLQQHHDWVDQYADDSAVLADLSYTLCHRRSALPYRFHCTASDKSTLLSGFQKGLADARRKTRPASPQTVIIFVFTGQGAQWLGMGRELLLAHTATVAAAASPENVFRDSIRTSRDMLHQLGAAWDLETALLETDTAASQLNTAEHAQPATTAVQIALVALLRSFGVMPTAVVGHSSGEIAAAYAAGRLSHHTALRVAFHRGFMAALSKERGLPPGAMMSVGLGETEAAPFVEGLSRGRACIACVNSPNSVTISGDADAVDEVATRLAAHEKNMGVRVFHKRLVVDTAYHSHHMRSVADDYAARLGHVDVADTPQTEDVQVAFVSSVTGTTKISSFDGAYWTANLVSPVRFSDAVQELVRKMPGQAQHAVFVEVGPHPALAGPVRQSIQIIANEGPASSLTFEYTSALERKVDSVTSSLRLAGRLFEQGVRLDWDAVSALSTATSTTSGKTVLPRPLVLSNLPPYPWDHSSEHWHKSRVADMYRFRPAPYHDLLGVRVANGTDIEPRWRHKVGLAALPWLADHVVDGVVVFPASAYMCMAVEAVAQLCSEHHAEETLETLALRDVSFLRALVVPPKPHRIELQLSFRPLPGSSSPLAFTFSVTALSDGRWHEHCTGSIQGILVKAGGNNKDQTPLLLQTQDKPAKPISVDVSVDLDKDQTVTTTTAEQIYQDLAKAGNSYGPLFSGIQSLDVVLSEEDVVAAEHEPIKTKAVISIPDSAAVMPAQHQQPHIVHPTTLDILLHATLPMVTRKLGRGPVMPVHVSEMLLAATDTMPRAPGDQFEISATLTDTHSRFRTAYAALSASPSGDMATGAVLSMTGIELRSLGSPQSTSPSSVRPDDDCASGICYELEWQVDAEHMRADDLQPAADLATLVGQFCFKTADITMVELEVDRSRLDLAKALLGAAYEHGASVTSYDLVMSQSGLDTKAHNQIVDDVRAVLQEHDDVLNYHIINRDENIADVQGLAARSRDIIIAKAGSIADALYLVKPDGAVIFVFEKADNSDADECEFILQAGHHALEVQFRFEDERLGCSVVVARPNMHTPLSLQLAASQVCILTHSNRPNGDRVSSVSWPSALATRLRALGAIVTLDTLCDMDSEIVEAYANSGLVIVADDGPHSILSDAHSFIPTIALLKHSDSRVVWISPDIPAMHQITGVARTAHAENDSLGLITVHAAEALLADLAHSEGGINAQRILGLLESCLGRLSLSKVEGERQVIQEREYRVHENGTVLVPRLLCSERLNRFVRTAREDDPTNSTSVIKSRFLDSKRPLLLSLSRPSGKGGADKLVFGDDDGANANVEGAPSLLREDDIELETHAVELSVSTVRASAASRKPIGGYAGVVTKVGPAVSHIFAPGDRVVALGSLVRSQLRIRAAHAARLPHGVSATAGASLLLHAMEASYALRQLANLPPRGAVVLVHGDGDGTDSPVIRATVAVARSIGLRVAINAFDEANGRVLMSQYDIEADEVFITRPSLQRRSAQDMFPHGLDAVVRAGKSPVGSEVLSCLKPFGSIFELTPARTAQARLVPSGSYSSIDIAPNIAIHACDIHALLIARSEMKSTLVAQAITAFAHLPLKEMHLVVRDIGQVEDAVRMLNTGVADQVTLSAGPDSTVPTFMLPPTTQEELSAAAKNQEWAPADASYVVAGGLGDLGRRLLTLMAKRGAKHLITLSRKGANHKQREEMQAQLESILPGCCLYCLVCDITSEASVQEAAETLRRARVPAVRGVVQSAAIFQDAILDTMTHDDFIASTRIKVDGTLGLIRAFASPDLAFFIMLSSVAGVVGSSGQGNYNAGNTVQDALAQIGISDANLLYRCSGCHFTSLDIGWIEDAAVSAENEIRQSAFRRAGLRSIRPNELSRFLEYALDAAVASDADAVKQAVIGFDAQSLSNATTQNGTVRSAMFSHVCGIPSVGGPSNVGNNAKTWAQVSGTGDEGAIVEFLANSIKDKVARLISVDAATIDEASGSILALGLDSLVAIELRNWVMREYGAPLHSSEVMTDQTFCELAKKVSSRSRSRAAASASTSANGTSAGSTQTLRDTEEGGQSREEGQGPGLSDTSITPTTSPTSVGDEVPLKHEERLSEPKLPPLPLPSLETTLRLFEESRRAIDSAKEQEMTAAAVRAFLEGPGSAVQQRLELLGADGIANGYERLLYLDRREPLQDFGQFVLGFPAEAPSRSQAETAAVITANVFGFSRRLAAGLVEPDVVHGISICPRARDWLFHSTRIPGVGGDRMAKSPRNETVVVLRRGHVFELTVPDSCDLTGIFRAYISIIEASDEPRLPICTLSSDNRDSWAQVSSYWYRYKLLCHLLTKAVTVLQMRHDLELDVGNAAAFAAIDSAAFVLCLDDESPRTAGERHMQFLLQGCNGHQAFSNRWQDKSMQFAVTANGLAAGLYEHAKLDALHVRKLHNDIIRDLFGFRADLSLETSNASSLSSCTIRELILEPNNPSISQRIAHIHTHAPSRYGNLDHHEIHARDLHRAFLHASQAPPNATAHLTVLLALYLVDGHPRPAWEVALPAAFHRGRPDFVQTVSPAVHAFVEAAGTSSPSPSPSPTRHDLRTLFDAAANAHTQAISVASRGRGYTNHMYALWGVLSPEERAAADTVLFRTRAWLATKRGGPQQDLKIGFMPDEEEDDLGEGIPAEVRWDREGGFLMDGERGVYVHCRVRNTGTSFAFTARPEYAAAIAEKLDVAAGIVALILGQ